MRKKQKVGKLIYGVIGMGRFGTALAEELYTSGADLIILDKEEDKVAKLRSISGDLSP